MAPTVQFLWVSQVALVVKNLPANAGDTRDWSLIPGWEDLLEFEMATHSSILAERHTGPVFIIQRWNKNYIQDLGYPDKGNAGTWTNKYRTGPVYIGCLTSLPHTVAPDTTHTYTHIHNGFHQIYTAQQYKHKWNCLLSEETELKDVSKFFCKGPDNKYWGSARHHMVSVTPINCVIIMKVAIDNRSMKDGGCCNKTLFTQTEIWNSCIFHVS